MEPSDEAVGGREAHRAVQRREFTGQDFQQGALARTVGADDPDHIARRHRDVEVLEQDAVGVAARQILGDERGGQVYQPAFCASSIA